jgi:hypothetical protein
MTKALGKNCELISSDLNFAEVTPHMLFLTIFCIEFLHLSFHSFDNYSSSKESVSDIEDGVCVLSISN